MSDPEVPEVTGEHFVEAWKQLNPTPNAKPIIGARTLIFFGCSVGAGENSMAQKIADGTGATVWASKVNNTFAPKYVLRTSQPFFEDSKSYNAELKIFRLQFEGILTDFLKNGTPVGDLEFIKVWNNKVQELIKKHPGDGNSATFTTAYLDIYWTNTILEPYTKTK